MLMWKEPVAESDIEEAKRTIVDFAHSLWRGDREGIQRTALDHPNLDRLWRDHVKPVSREHQKELDEFLEAISVDGPAPLQQEESFQQMLFYLLR